MEDKTQTANKEMSESVSSVTKKIQEMTEKLNHRNNDSVVILTDEEKTLQKKLQTELVQHVSQVRNEIIGTMDSTPLTRESAILAIDAMASETMRIIETNITMVMGSVVDGSDRFVPVEGLADLYFDQINS